MQQSFNKFGEPLIRGSTFSDSYTKDQADFNFLEDNSNIDLNNKFKIINLPDPTEGSDASNKDYVDEGDNLATQRSMILGNKIRIINDEITKLKDSLNSFQQTVNQAQELINFGKLPKLECKDLFAERMKTSGISELKQVLSEKGVIDDLISKTINTDKLKTKTLEVEGNWLNENILQSMFAKIDENEKHVIQMIYTILLESDLIDDKSEIEKKFKFKTEDKYLYISQMFPSEGTHSRRRALEN